MELKVKDIDRNILNQRNFIVFSDDKICIQNNACYGLALGYYS